MKYNLIYADPPWTFKDKCKSGNRGASQKYNCMQLDDICSLPIADLAADNCLLAMWHVPTMPLEALKVAESWGFTFKTLKGFTWHKLTAKGKDHFGMGNYTRANSEDCLFAIKGKFERQSASVRQLIHAKVGKHSEKPAIVRDSLVELCGDVPRLELFARTQVEGWDVFGNEVDNSIIL